MNKNSCRFKELTGNIWFILFFNTAFFALMAWLLPIHFEENDDATMCMIANGHYSGTPDGHLVFINAIYGWVIASLYKVADIVEWYTLSFCILHIMAMTVIMYFVFNKLRMPKTIKIAFVLFAYLFWIRIIIAFQFTTTAGLLCFSGCLAMLQPFSDRSIRCNVRRYDVIWKMYGLCAILLASLIRFPAAALVGLLSISMFIEAYLRNRHVLIWLLGLFALVLCGKYSDGLFYRNTDWAYYREYNSIRGKINDNPFADLNQEDLPEGVSELDYDLLMKFATDPNVMTLDRIKTIQSKMQSKVSVKTCCEHLKQLRPFMYPILFVCIGLIACLVMVKQLRWYPLMAFSVFLVVLIYLGGFASLKYRVFLCMLFPMMFQIMYWFSLLSRENTRVTIPCIVIVITFIGVCAKIVKQDIALVNHINAWNREMIEGYQKPILKGKEDWIFCTYSGWANTEFIHPFRLHDCPVRFVNFSWMVGNPQNVLKCHKDLVDSNVLCGCRVTDGPDKMMETSGKLVKAIKKNYGIDVDVDVVDSNAKYVLYRFVSKKDSVLSF